MQFGIEIINMLICSGFIGTFHMMRAGHKVRVGDQSSKIGEHPEWFRATSGVRMFGYLKAAHGKGASIATL